MNCRFPGVGTFALVGGIWPEAAPSSGRDPQVHVRLRAAEEYESWHPDGEVHRQ